mgnify:CR=1 FL=1
MISAAIVAIAVRWPGLPWRLGAVLPPGALALLHVVMMVMVVIVPGMLIMPGILIDMRIILNIHILRGWIGFCNRAMVSR